MPDKKHVFITGITGTLGKDFVRELLLTTGYTLHVLVRRKKRHSHWDRVRRILEGFQLSHFLGTRVQVLEGDVTLPNFGLSEGDMGYLRTRVDEFFHVAALTALNGSYEDCQAINVGGASHALEIGWDFFKNGRLKRFFYFSTAYVAGSRQTYISMENSLPEKPAFANFYESSKFEAEMKVREALADGLPATIFRPSIVVGDSLTGAVSEFNVIYPFLKLFGHGIIRVLPSRLENSFNIVPIDFVIRAAIAISKQASSLGKVFHLVTQDPPTIAMLLRVKDEEYPGAPPIEVVDPADFRRDSFEPMVRSVYDMLEPYMGYLNDNLSFDTTNTEEALRGTGIEMPRTDYQFLKLLIRYAVQVGYLVLPVVQPADPVAS